MIRSMLVLIYAAQVAKIACLPLGKSWADDIIIHQVEVPWDGRTYAFGFETLFGVSRRESGKQMQNTAGVKYLDVAGEYAYPMPDGAIQKVFYRANDEGYHASEPIIQYPEEQNAAYARNSQDEIINEIPKASESIVNNYILNRANPYSKNAKMHWTDDNDTLKNLLKTEENTTHNPEKPDFALTVLNDTRDHEPKFGENVTDNTRNLEKLRNSLNDTHNNLFRSRIQQNNIVPDFQEKKSDSNRVVSGRKLDPDRIIFPSDTDENIIADDLVNDILRHRVDTSITNTEVPSAADVNNTTSTDYDYDEFGFRLGVPPHVLASLLGG